MKPIFEYTPRQIVKELDEYIIGQNDAKRSVAIALRNRWRRRQIEDEIRDEIIPNNILMIGSTGVGKTEIARRLARLSGAPFVKLEASKFTEVGYVGRDVEGMIRDLVEAAVAQVRSERTKEVESIARKNVEERLLDILLPPPSKKTTAKPGSFTEVLDGLGLVPELENKIKEEPKQDGRAQERYQRSREKMFSRLKEGKLENREIELSLQEKNTGMMQVFGPIGMEEMGINLQDILGSSFPQKRKARKVSVGEARSLLFGEEVDKMLDMDSIVNEAIQRTEQTGIVFLDEIDKIASVESGAGPDVSREGVQRDILPIVEGTRVTTKYGPVNTDHILFIAAGAFHIARPSDLIPELQGRFPIRVELDNLTKKDFIRILTEPKNALVSQYVALFKTEGVALTFDKAAISEIADIAMKANDSTENIGARRLQTVMNSLLEDELFKVPNKRIKKIQVTREMVKDRLDDLVENEDLSRYIL